MKAFMNWSGGKDSALAFYKAQKAGIPVETLLTSVNAGTNRVSMHGFRRELLQLQAAAIGLPLQTIELPEMPNMQTYETNVQDQHRRLKAAGFTHGIFGDLFLQDLKHYRENLLAKDGLQCLFPLWEMDSRQVMQEFIEAEFKAIVVCVNSSLLDRRFCGRILDESFLNDLPSEVDPCGENGEYHSFVFDGPVFRQPISFLKGELVFKEYKAPVLQPAFDQQDDCFTEPKKEVGFFFQDLMTS